MLIKIGDCWVDPLEIAMIKGGADPIGEDTMHPQICITLRHGGSSWIEATMDEAEAALIDAGLIENEYGGGDPGLNEGELGLLAALDAEGYEWLARDGDGKLYAFRSKPTKDGVYWEDGSDPSQFRPRFIPEGFDFINANDDTPWSIAYLLAC